MSKLPTVIKFFAPITAVTINALMEAFDRKMKEGQRNFILLISSPGGLVFYGLSAYNYLKGIPANITTHNFGSVDSIGVVLFCSGSKRLCVPQARFSFHGISTNFAQKKAFEEKQLEEHLGRLRIDIQNTAKVVSANTDKSIDEITSAMLDKTTLNPDEAKKWGLVNQIKKDLFPSGAEVIPIHFPQPPASHATSQGVANVMDVGV